MNNCYVSMLLTFKGAHMLVRDYLATVENLCAGNPYPEAQARGSLGGASRSGFVRIANCMVTRVR